jgi:hypothetical protein
MVFVPLFCVLDIELRQKVPKVFIIEVVEISQHEDAFSKRDHAHMFGNIVEGKSF